jgi:hypothetical protein
VAAIHQNESTARAESLSAYWICSADPISAGQAAAVALASVSASTAPPHRKADVIADDPSLHRVAGAVLLNQPHVRD